MAHKVVINGDPDLDESIVIQAVDATTNVPIDPPDKGKISIKLGDCLGSDGDYHEVKLREISVCVDGATKKMLVICSEPFDPA